MVAFDALPSATEWFSCCSVCGRNWRVGWWLLTAGRAGIYYPGFATCSEIEMRKKHFVVALFLVYSILVSPFVRVQE